jgi:nitroreductase/dihydropteridine reductase
MELLELLKWRYATKKMNPQKAVAQDKVERITEAVRLAPTSSGLQPFEIIVVTNAELREKIKAIAWNNYTAERINGMFDLTNAQRGSTNEGWESYRQKLLATYPPRSAHENFEHAARQAYIGLGVALLAAAAEAVDSTPMEGFDNAALDELLGLAGKGLKSVAIMPLGYREADQDWLVELKKVRRPRAQFVSEVA